DHHRTWYSLRKPADCAVGLAQIIALTVLSPQSQNGGRQSLLQYRRERGRSSRRAYLARICCRNSFRDTVPPLPVDGRGRATIQWFNDSRSRFFLDRPLTPS